MYGVYKKETMPIWRDGEGWIITSLGSELLFVSNNETFCRNYVKKWNSYVKECTSEIEYKSDKDLDYLFVREVESDPDINVSPIVFETFNVLHNEKES